MQQTFHAMTLHRFMQSFQPSQVILSDITTRICTFMIILVVNFTYNFWVAIVTLVSNVTNVPMVTFSAMFIKVTVAHWLLQTRKGERSNTLCEHFLYS